MTSLFPTRLFPKFNLLRWLAAITLILKSLVRFKVARHFLFFWKKILSCCRQSNFILLQAHLIINKNFGSSGNWYSLQDYNFTYLSKPDGVSIASKSHTHPSYSQTSRLLTSSLSLGVTVPRPLPRPTQYLRDV